MQRENRCQLTKLGWMASLAILVCLLMPALAKADSDKEQARLKEAGEVVKDLLSKDRGIPLDVLNKAECVIVLPSVKKGGFIIAGQYGKGAMTCRSGENFNGPWSAPIMMSSSGGSIGFQAGGQSTDFVVLVMNDKGARTMLHGKAKLGADASVAAGPVGKTAEASTNASMNAEMLSYSESNGAFAGVSLSGTTMGPDEDANKNLYDKKVTGEEIFKGEQAPPAASTMLSTLTEKSPKNTSDGKS
jgi:SH3 domain-containing YSC84-like protein 1